MVKNCISLLLVALVATTTVAAPTRSMFLASSHMLKDDSMNITEPDVNFVFTCIRGGMDGFIKTFYGNTAY